MTRTRLSAADRRALVLDAGAALFAERAYDDVVMDDVATRAGISRALLYRHFPSKRDLFAGVYARAADRLLEGSPIDPSLPLPEQVRAGLDAHLDYFVAHRRTVLTANRTLAGDPTIQAIITDELAVLRDRLLDATGLDGEQRAFTGSVLLAWLVFVRVLCVEWLAAGADDRDAAGRDRVREVCAGALLGALNSVAG